MSIIEWQGDTAAEVYEEGLYKFRVSGRKEATRNGPVIVLPDVAAFTLTDPRCRVIDDSTRNANPFFHMMEFVWMMAGRKDVTWLLQFNKQMTEYADDGYLRAAYGWRWRNHWCADQIRVVIEKLAKDPTTRQAVLQMWSPQDDLFGNYKDKACNVTIMFRYNAGALDCLVCNRSNDFVWGALGANICHLTMLHELVAHFAGLPLGKYTVISNNLHMYTDRPDFQPAISQLVVEDVYDSEPPQDMFAGGDTYSGFVSDCEVFCNGRLTDVNTPWMQDTVYTTYMAWQNRKDDQRKNYEDYIKSPDWRTACQNYLTRKTLSSVT
jgi:thymidylate synthase